MSDANVGPRPAFDETRAQVETPRALQNIGPYRLIQPLGEGGMGIVWLAEQIRPVRRQVALKIIKAGMDTAQVVARFEAERQALALMDHPAIARVLDAGATPEGRPYFVMEFVRGESITGYCAKHKVSIRDRIGLFLQVCDGVQHAHQKGIIHRDLKPSNVLIAIQGDHPVPKIIDFGVAKATTQPLTERTLHTELGAFVGTPEYMSPEQAEMSGLDVDTRTDVYSLGAILYELLTGAMPFESKALRAQLLDELRRTIREVDPPRPSTRVTASAPADAARPPAHIERSKLAHELKGDLDWITMKALEKDRTRRYGSASDLAADLQRHLHDEPVLAGPPTATYRVGKFVRRHRGGVAAAAVLVVLLAGFAVTMAVQAKRIASERDRASREEASAKALSDFLRNDVLAQASIANQAGPDVKPDPDIKVRTALDRAAARVDGKFGGQPLVEASIRETIGATYGGLGLYDQSRQQLQRSLEIARRLTGEEGAPTLRALDTLAWVDTRSANSAEAVRRLTALLAVYTRRLGPKHPDVLRTINNLAWNEFMEGKRDQAETKFVDLVRREREILGGENSVTVTSLTNLASIYLDRGAWKEAEPLLAEALATNRRMRGAEHPLSVSIMDRLAMVQGQQGLYKDAEAIRREVLAVRLRTAGPEDSGTVNAQASLAQNLLNQDDPAKLPEAERLYTGSLAISRRVNGERSRTASFLRWNVGDLYEKQGRHAEAEVMLREAVSGLRESAGPAHPNTLGALESLGFACLQQRKYLDAEPVLREAAAGRAQTMPKSWHRFSAQSMLGASLAGQRRFGEAEPLVVGGYEGMGQAGSIPAYFRIELTNAGQRVIDLYTAWGRPAQAAEWRKKVAAPYRP